MVSGLSRAPVWRPMAHPGGACRSRSEQRAKLFQADRQTGRPADRQFPRNAPASPAFWGSTARWLGRTGTDLRTDSPFGSLGAVEE